MFGVFELFWAGPFWKMGKVQSKQVKNNYDEEICRFLADDLWLKVECDFGWCSAGAVDFPFGPCVILRTC